MPIIRLQIEAFALEDAETLTRGRADTGALAIFAGYVRDFNDGADVKSLFLDHYPGMTETALEAIALHAEARWQLTGTLIVHRVGHLKPNDKIVLVAAASAHRASAFDACRYMMDALKTEAPFWKNEVGHHGSRWVEARESDTKARANWNSSQPIIGAS